MKKCIQIYKGKKNILLFLLFLIFLKLILHSSKAKERSFNLSFEYHNYEREIITEKIKLNSGWELVGNEPYFINGIIRKFRPKKCLEIGVSRGGSSILILNAIKDIKNSFLISMDLNKKFYKNSKLEVGYKAKIFPELLNKWKLYIGEQPHKFLEKLNIKFDFLFLDTVHASPGEIINIIEALPFLEENAIIIIHDIVYHIFKSVGRSFHPSNIYLFSALVGDKIFIPKKEYGIENIGAVFLKSKQNKYYINYFILLLSPWQYIPNNKYIKELQAFIQKYYKKNIYLYLFNEAVEANKIYCQK